MKLIVATILIALSLTGSMGDQPDPDADNLCDKVKCGAGKVCRVVEKCGDKRKLRAKCVPCVPEGVDDVCSVYRYQRAVLIGPNRALKPLSCHIHGVPNKFACPAGSVCKGDPKTPGIGQCCYDKIDLDDPNVLPYGKASNDDPQCSRCRPACRSGHECMADVLCGKLSYVCKPVEKQGICPTYSTSSSCYAVDEERACEYDEDCEGHLKCCLTACGGTACRHGYFFPGKK